VHGPQSAGERKCNHVKVDLYFKPLVLPCISSYMNKQRGPYQAPSALKSLGEGLRVGPAIAAAIGLLLCPPDALGILIAPNAKIARTPEAALRRSIPASNEMVR
jgi:hypothetical protein